MSSRLEQARESRRVQFETEVVARDLRLLRNHLDFLTEQDAARVINISCYPYITQNQLELIKYLAATLRMELTVLTRKQVL